MSFPRPFQANASFAQLWAGLAISVFLAFSPASAFAVRATRDPAPDFSVNVPEQEQIDVSGEIKRAEIEHRPVDYELSVSTWKPSNLTRPSYYPNVSSFGRGSMPEISFSRIAELKTYAEGDGFYWRVGASYANLERDGIVSLAQVNFPSSQTLNLISLRAGVDYRFQRMLAQVLQPYVGVAVLPTVALAAQSDFEGNVGKFIVPFDLSAGLLFHPAFLQNFLDLGNLSLGMQADYTLGRLDGSSLAGFGVAGLVQLTL